jgi:exopolysaccharide production protein ExoQ
MPLRAISQAHTGLAVAVFFVLFAGEAIRNLLGWNIFGAITIGLALTYLVLLWRARRRIAWRRLPLTLIGFVALAIASIAWSANPGESALTALALVLTTIGGLGIALLLPWRDIVRALGTTLRWILALSFAFEIFVSGVIGHAVAPLALNYGDPKISGIYLWSRDLLFEGGPIQGIVGNRNQLGFIALIALIIFCIQLVDGTVWRIWGIAWLAIALGTLALTRSSTVLLATLAVLLVLAFALWARSIRPSARRGLYGVATLVVLGIVALGTFGRGILSTALGKSEDLTGRVTIWNAVTELAGQRPTWGWGWLSPWLPSTEPFGTLVTIKGVHYLQAHNTWLDVWVQLGVIGLVILGFFVLSTTWRAWFVAVDRPRWDLTDQRPFTASSLLPLLIVTALLAQSLAESQLIVQSGWALVVICAVLLKTPARVHGAQP